MQRIVADLEPAPHLPHGVLTGSVVGGGRIKCDHRGKSADVYGAQTPDACCRRPMCANSGVCAGYSRTFGRKEGCNKRSAGMISTALGYKVSWSDDGY